MASLSEEEENYVRLALLSKAVTPRAVRTYFDREFPPTYLPSTLSSCNNTLLDLKVKRIINLAQWKLLNPRNGVPDSKTFDVTLMICLIRNLTSIIPPIKGFDTLPLPGEITPGSDLARIKYHRNNLVNHDRNTMDTSYFNTAWRDISVAVGRLGGQTMYQECQGLKVKILDQSDQEIMLEIKQSLEELKEQKLTMYNLSMERSKVMEILTDPIPWNIKGLFEEQNIKNRSFQQIVNEPFPQVAETIWIHQRKKIGQKPCQTRKMTAICIIQKKWKVYHQVISHLPKPSKEHKTR